MYLKILSLGGTTLAFRIGLLCLKFKKINLYEEHNNELITLSFPPTIMGSISSRSSCFPATLYPAPPSSSPALRSFLRVGTLDLAS